MIPGSNFYAIATSSSIIEGSSEGQYSTMGLLHKLTRRKFISADTVESTQLARCLNTVDLTALGSCNAEREHAGPSHELGLCLMCPEIMSVNAGPTVCAMLSLEHEFLESLCYAEFGARVPRTGSAYVYSYVTIGELMAFVIGWNLILEYVIAHIN
ncbi:CTR2-like protein [Mya arenaria]|uniref:CTR2-like protein n=1 Tax=Mya arenaria TaxID=6604 RepID=A0ABY7EVJ8_MYAAR|nr:CTR2-like protein [Mya arenaria]